MARRTGLIVGSLIGAVAIQIALISCRDAMVSDDSGMHMPDSGDRDAFDAFEAAAVDAIDVVLDIPEARADGGSDGGPTCTCQQPQQPVATVSGSFRQQGNPVQIRPSPSKASLFVVHSLYAGQPVLIWNATASLWLQDGRAVDVSCAMMTRPNGDMTGLPATEQRCGLSVRSAIGAIEGTQTYNTSAPVTATIVSAGRVEINVQPTIAPQGIVTNFSISLADPSNGILTPPSDYR